MIRSSRILVSFVVVALACAIANAQTATAPPPQSMMVAPEHRQPMVSLSPAVVMARGSFGQTMTQTVTLTNDTAREFGFEMVAQDVIVKNGKREFVTAGNLPNSIAQTAVFSQKTGDIKPYTSASVDVRLTIPAETPIRAVVVIFRGKDIVATGKNAVGMTASLGALITFNLSENVKLEGAPVTAKAAESEGIDIEQTLTNVGSEPAMVEGVAAILTSDGKLSAKVPFDPQRLLPGERLRFAAEYPSRLPAGTYRVLCSYEFEGKQLTSSGSLQIR